MSPSRTNKTFDCVAFKDKIQEEIYEEIKDLTPRQQIEYFNRHAEAGPLAESWGRIRRAQARPSSAD